MADIDLDGNYDLIFSFHNRNWTRIFFGTPSHTSFSLFYPANSSFPFRTRTLDVHGITVGPVSTRTRKRLAVFSVGGSRGTKLRPPEVYEFEGRAIREVTRKSGLGRRATRPRTALFLELGGRNKTEMRRNWGGPDVVFVGFNVPREGREQWGYENQRGKWSLVEEGIGEYGRQKRGSAELTDVDGDGFMEIISIQELRIYKNMGRFQTKEITKQVVPREMMIEKLSITAVCELDYDNDGMWDLYVARAGKLIGKERDFENVDDVLLRNVNGRYVDVSREAGIPQGTNSVGVTVGDVNNDGWVDIIVILTGGKDMVLLNRGNGRFQRVDGLIPKENGEIGNNAVAVDYDQDGAVDLLVGHGGVKNGQFGRYMVLRNQRRLGGWVLVRVLNAPDGSATSLHAVVEVERDDGRKWWRRVGSRGAQAGGTSYVDMVHIGVGERGGRVNVTVTWVGGEKEVREDVKVGSKVTVGVLPAIVRTERRGGGNGV